MIIYVNGDSHSAGAECVTNHAFAEDDPLFLHLGRAPHPENARHSWPVRLAELIKAGYKNHSESASSNDRIRRTTIEWLTGNNNPRGCLMLIQWSTWEREEWLHNDVYYQVNASGIDSVPEELAERYKEFVAGINWIECERREHEKIWQFHQELEQRGMPHVFFNGNNHFGRIQPDAQRDWGYSYIGPYDSSLTYNQWLLDNNFETVTAKSWHFGKEAHSAWSKFMLQYIIQNQLIFD